MADALDEIDRPNLTLKELWEYLYLDNKLEVKHRHLYQAYLDGELIPTRLSNKNFYSRRDGLDWVAAQKGRKRAKAGEAKAKRANMSTAQ